MVRLFSPFEGLGCTKKVGDMQDTFDFFSCWEENSNFSYSLFCNFLHAYCLTVLLFIHLTSNEASLAYCLSILSPMKQT